MARIIKTLLFLLLVVILQVSFSNNFTDAKFCDTSVMYDSSKQSFDSARLTHFPEAELGSIGLYLQQAASSRSYRSHFATPIFTLRRIDELTALHKSMLFKYSQKLEDDSLLFSITHPVGEYYIFGLRQIVI